MASNRELQWPPGFVLQAPRVPGHVNIDSSLLLVSRMANGSSKILLQASRVMTSSTDFTPTRPVSGLQGSCGGPVL